MAFVRRIEDFTCSHCRAKVTGNGYTDHCPQCLWSKHVDVEPGDRAADCGGMMEPIALEGSTAKYRIRYHCQKCGADRINNVQKEDEETALVTLANRRA